jgi:hypothetical protein
LILAVTVAASAQSTPPASGQTPPPAGQTNPATLTQPAPADQAKPVVPADAAQKAADPNATPTAAPAPAREQPPDTKALRDASSITDPDKQIEALKKDPTAKPRPATSDADYSTRFVSVRQTGMMTLAQVYEKKGKAADAEKTYRDAYMLQPKTGGAAALKLADFAKTAGHPYEQLEYLTVATLAGRVTAASRAELEAVYKQTHGGSPADLDAMLDERYEKEATKVDAPPYKASKTRTGRVVLAELFTGAGCPPCVAADLAFEAALERYSPDDIAVLVYHLHLPGRTR